MVQITYISSDELFFTVVVEPGVTVLEAALTHAVPGVSADCEGRCACTSCHVHIGFDWAERLDPPSTLEAALLEFAEHNEPVSRLSCRLRVTQDLDGMTVRIPAGNS